MKEFPTELTQPNKPPETTEGNGAISRFDKLSKSTVGKTLRAGIAAGSIISAQPGITETPQPEQIATEKTTLIINNPEGGETTANTLERTRSQQAKEAVENTIDTLKIRFKDYPEVISEKIRSLEEQKESPDYLKGIVFLTDIGADLHSCIDRVEAEKIKDIAWLKQRLSVIPDDIRGKLQITNLDFDTREDYYDPDKYSTPAFKDTVNTFAQENVKPTSFVVMTILESEHFKDAREPLIGAYAKLLSQGFSGEDVIFLFLDNINDPSLLENDSLINGIVDLHNIGIETSTISPLIQSENIENMTSDHYLDTVKKLQAAGIEIKRETLLSIPAQGLDDNAITNVTYLSEKYENLREDIFEIPSNLLSQDDLIETIDNLQKNKEIAEGRTIYGITQALKLTAITNESGDPELLKTVKDISEQTSIGFSPFDGLVSIKERRLSDPIYYDSLLSYLKEGREQKYISASSVDSIYLEKVTGESLSSVRTDINAYLAISNQEELPTIAQEILASYEEIVFIDFVEKMSREDSQENRLQDLSGLDTRTKFKILSTVGEHGWTSTRNLIYDGYHIAENAPERSLTLYNSIIDEYGDAYTFLTEINPSSAELSSFLEILAQIGKVDSFFDLIGSDEQKSDIVQKFLLGLEQTSDTHSKVAGLVEALRTLKWNGAEEIILMGMESEVERLTTLIETKKLEGSDLKKAQDAILWHELITASYYKKHAQSDASEWGQKALEKYGDALPLFETITETTLFPNDTHIRYHTFFNNWDSQNSLKDKDGHRSFETTLKRFGGNVSFDKEGKLVNASGGRGGWQIEMRSNEDGNYVMMTKTDEDSGRKMINIMNSPKMTNEKVIDFYKNMSNNFSDEDTGAHGVQGFVMRGHNIASISNTAVTVFNDLIDSGKNDIPYVNFGSCGGHKYGQKILEKSPSSFFFGTQGTGMADVNVNVQMRDMEYSLATGEYNSIDLQRMSNKKFEGYSTRMQDGYRSYRWPHDNGVVQVFAAFNAIQGQK